MSGVKDFINNTNVNLDVTLTVRNGNQPTCVYRRVDFTLASQETGTIVYGNDENPFLDGIEACSCSHIELTGTQIYVRLIGSPVDDLLNTNRIITFSKVNSSLVLTGSNG